MKKYFAICLFTIVFAFVANAQSSKVVKFPKGKTKVTLKGTITDYKYVDYIVNVKTTQFLSAKVTGGKSQMVIFEPDGENMPDAAGIGEITTKIDVSGNYKIRVIMSRNDARRKRAKSNFTLTVEVDKLK